MEALFGNLIKNLYHNFTLGLSGSYYNDKKYARFRYKDCMEEVVN